ncbi:MAG TPA: ABC transporter permease [Conexibacter sp.]|nr:ABC transporter permease [Conexibacter sp.]
MSAVGSTRGLLTPTAPTPAKRRRRFLASGEGIAGLAILLFVVAVALIGPLVAPHALDAPIGPPGAPPGDGAPLGTDVLGRDVLSRVLYGGLSVLRLSVATIALTYLIGGTIGMLAGLSRSHLDPLLMRTVDIFLSLPSLLLILLLIAGAGQSEVVLIVAIVLVLFPGAARIVRTATLEISTAGYIEAAVGRGERTVAIMRREVLPNIAPAILADLGVRFSSAIVLAASVNFLGLGASPPAANWGLMIAENRPIITTNLWSVLVPAAFLALLTISVNMIGDAYVRSLGRSDRR